ncbi:MAG: hypothetical protein ACOCU8_02680 [Patescibacteria group bacterium]
MLSRNVFKILFLLFIILGLGTGLVFAVSNKPFGGLITELKYCSCSNNFLLTLKPAASWLPDEVIYQPGVSILYQYRQIKEGAQVLGTHEGFSICIRGSDCDRKTKAPLIFMVGTSR